MKAKFAFVACLASAFVLASCGARAATPEEISSYSAEQSRSAEEASKSAAASTSADPAPTSSSSVTSSSTDPAPSSSSSSVPSGDSSSSASSDPSSSSSSDPVSYDYFVSVGGAAKVGLAASTQALVTGQTGEYFANEVTVTAGDSITFFSGDLAIASNIGSDPQGEGTDGKMHYNNGVVTEDPFSITIHDSGSVSIYLKTWDGGGYSFWITGHTKDGSDPEPVASGFGVKIGIADIVALTEDTTKTLATNQTGEYYLKGVNLAKDTAIVFYDGTTAITSKIGSDPQGKGTDGKMHYNNGVVTESPFAITVHNDKAAAEIYLKTWSDGGYSFWITGHADDGSDPVAPSELDNITTKYGIKNTVTGKYLSGCDPLENKDYQGRDQAKASDVVFTAGVTFSIVDHENSDAVVPADLENTDLGSKLSVTAGVFTVLADFTADVYVKTKWEDNKIYIAVK